MPGLLLYIQHKVVHRTIHNLHFSTANWTRSGPGHPPLHIHKPIAESSLLKSGVPRPVTGSQPDLAGKPFVLQPGFEPEVMSLSADAPVEYRKGLRNPSGLRPAAMRRSLSRAMMLASVGLAQLVPSTPPSWPSTTISKSTPCVAMSGNPRPLALYLPELVEPSWLR